MASRDKEVDVVVVGSGAGGLSAAICCAKAGLDVLVLEKTDFFGGCTAISGGVVWIPDNQAMEKQGMPDRPTDAERYLKNILGDRFDQQKIAAFLDNGPKMVTFFEQHTEVKFAPRMYSPDYEYETPGAAIGGRPLDPLEFDGRGLGRKWFARLRAPLLQLTAFDGMMVSRYDIVHLLKMWKSWESLKHGCKVLGRYVMDRLSFSRGTRLLAGNALAGRLLKSALDAGVTLKACSPVSELIIEGGRVSGVRIIRAGKDQESIRSRRGVVLATGGFAANQSLRQQYVRYADQHLTMAPEGSRGDGYHMASAVGADITSSNCHSVFLTPVSIDPVGEKRRFPHLILDRQKPGLIAVNSAGKRFVNEADSYHSFVEGMYRSHKQVDSIPSYLLCDSVFISKYGLGMVKPWPFPRGHFLRSGYLIQSQSLAELASKIGVDEVNLIAEVTQMNVAARTGLDQRFGKGSREYNRYLGDPQHSPNPCLGPISTPPFFAVKVYPGDIGSSAGIQTDQFSRVKCRDGGVIKGLYACGNDMNSIMGGTYPSGGITLGPAMTFGYIAAAHITQQPH